MSAPSGHIGSSQLVTERPAKLNRFAIRHPDVSRGTWTLLLAEPSRRRGSYEGETGTSYEPRRLPPPPVRLRAEPLSHRLPLQGGVIEASTRLPVELYHSPLEGESQKPSRMAKADAVGGKARLRTVRPQAAKTPTQQFCISCSSMQLNPLHLLDLEPGSPSRCFTWNIGLP